MNRWLPLFLCLAGAAMAHTPRQPVEDNCAFLFGFPVSAVRVEIGQAALRYSQQAANPDQKRWPLRGFEALAIPVLAGKHPTHVVSFGTGGDAFRMLRDFPAADVYHVVDPLDRGSASPAAILMEFRRRLRALPEARVQLTSPGFARGIPPRAFQDAGALAAAMQNNPNVANAMGFYVRWKSAAAGERQFQVWWHVLRPEIDGHVQLLLEEIRSEGALVGSMATGGAYGPLDRGFMSLLQATTQGGVFVFEAFRPLGMLYGPIPDLAEERAGALYVAGFDTQEVTSDSASRTFVFKRR